MQVPCFSFLLEPFLPELFFSCVGACGVVNFARADGQQDLLETLSARCRTHQAHCLDLVAEQAAARLEHVPASYGMP